MHNAGFSFGKNIPVNEKAAAAQNGQNNATTAEAVKPQAQSTSIFNSKGQAVTTSTETVKQQVQNPSIFNNKGQADINQMNNNSSGMGGVTNIFAGGGGLVSAGMDNTSIFSGLNKGSDYRLYSKKDYSFDVPKLTQEDIAAQKGSDGPRRTNPKANSSHIITKANPYEAFRNPEMQETSLKDTLGNAFSNLFGQKKAD